LSCVSPVVHGRVKVFGSGQLKVLALGF
jgi:hypothetical protein